MRRLFALLGILACAIALTRTAAASSPSVGARGPWAQPSITGDSRERATEAVPPARPHVVAAAPLTERLPAVPPDVFRIARRAVPVHLERREFPEPTSSFGHVRVMRHVPRMESGDP